MRKLLLFLMLLPGLVSADAVVTQFGPSSLPATLGFQDNPVNADSVIFYGGASYGNTPGGVAVNGGFNSYGELGALTEEITLSLGGTTTDSAANLLPSNASIEGVAVRVTTEITGAGVSSFQVGDGTTAARFATGVALALNTTTVGMVHLDQTGAAGPRQTSAAKLRVTAVGGTPTAGKVRVVVYYRLWAVPDS